MWRRILTNVLACLRSAAVVGDMEIARVDAATAPAAVGAAEVAVVVAAAPLCDDCRWHTQSHWPSWKRRPPKSTGCLNQWPRRMRKNRRPHGGEILEAIGEVGEEEEEPDLRLKQHREKYFVKNRKTMSLKLKIS